MNKNLLKSIIKLHDENGSDLAEALGISRQTFSAKLNGRNGAEFTQNEIAIIKKRYKLTAKEIDSIFFCRK